MTDNQHSHAVVFQILHNIQHIADEFGVKGAGFYIDNSSISFTNGYVWANKAQDSGGAFFITNGSSVSFSYIAMDTNESAEVGGGENTIGGALGLVFNSEVSFDHCTITNR